MEPQEKFIGLKQNQLNIRKICRTMRRSGTLCNRQNLHRTLWQKEGFRVLEQLQAELVEQSETNIHHSQTHVEHETSQPQRETIKKTQTEPYSNGILQDTVRTTSKVPQEVREDLILKELYRPLSATFGTVVELDEKPTNNPWQQQWNTCKCIENVLLQMRNLLKHSWTVTYHWKNSKTPTKSTQSNGTKNSAELRKLFPVYGLSSTIIGHTEPCCQCSR